MLRIIHYNNKDFLLNTTDEGLCELCDYDTLSPICWDFHVEPGDDAVAVALYILRRKYFPASN